MGYSMVAPERTASAAGRTGRSPGRRSAPVARSTQRRSELMTIGEFQRLIEELYYERDKARGRDRTFLWFVEEVGELARAMARPRDADGANLREEFADVLAWLATLASIEGVDLEAAAAAKYGRGCPKCGGRPCAC